MQRIFSLIANIPLAEYIRKRRLSLAGEDLLNSKLKIMDIAIKYQYENATSFSRAFEAFHGIKPSLARKQKEVKTYPRITFEEKTKTITDIKYKVKELDNLILYGIGISCNNKNISKIAPEFFEKMEEKYKKIYGNIKYGMTTYKDKGRFECDEYYCLYDKEIPTFKKIIIPASRWLVFLIPTQEAKDIQAIANQFYLEFLPSCGYNLKEIPELECYHDGITEFLIPIE
ncbi:MAG: helix-turn-helix domain-containing protein [Bacilli bacterium]|nr:helix-turn-helix domain-containing protein [Bacilli bacterium]